MKVIALSGWKGSGKDTVAEYLIETHGFNRIGFADPLKDRVSKEFGIDRNYLDDPKFKESPLLQFPIDPQDRFSKMIANFMIKEFRTIDGKQADLFTVSTNEGLIVDKEEESFYGKLYHTPRSLAILVGSTFRSVDSAHWVKKAINSIIKNTESSAFVISDLRYKSETQQLLKEFGKNLTTIRINRFENSTSNDPSERNLDDYNFDYVLNNIGTKQELYDNTDQILNKLNIK